MVRNALSNASGCLIISTTLKKPLTPIPLFLKVPFSLAAGKRSLD